MIKFDRVSKTYQTSHDEVQAIDGLSLSISQGEYIAICGPSGCGKSTLLSLVGGLTKPTLGQIVVDGQNLLQLSSAELSQFRQQTLSYVFQMFHLLPYLDVLQNVLLAVSENFDPKINSNPPPKNSRVEYAKSLLENFQLSERINHLPSQLSIGERQRVSLARAMINRPKILLADEPTGNLDPENATIVMNFLSDFHQQGGTVLLVTHDKKATQQADRAILLEHGKIIENQPI